MDPEIIDEEEEMVTVGLGEEGGEEPGAAEEELPEEDEPGEDAGAAEEEPPEEEEPGEEPGAMSREERHRQAAARRAREEAQRAAAHQAEIDAAYARAYAGQTDPYHGHKPIRTEADYRAYIQARDEEQERQNLERMRESGVDPQLLEQLISRAVQENPMVKQAGVAVQQAQKAMARAQDEEAARRVEQELTAIRGLDPSIRTADDLHDKYPDGWERTLELCKKGVSLSEAFKVANFDALMKNRGAAIRQEARNLKDSKAHLKSTRNSNQGTVTMPRAVLDEFRRINPGHTDAEYAAYWRKIHKNES